MNLLPRVPRVGATAFVVCLAVFLAANFAQFPERTVVSAAVILPFPADAVSNGGCDIDCCNATEGLCECPSGWHEAWDTTPNFYFWTRNGGQHQDVCFEYPWDIRHGPYCPKPTTQPLTAENLEQLRVAVLAQDIKALSGLLVEHQEIKVNLERLALQIENCKGRVVMHMPLPERLAMAVHSALSVTTD